MSGRGGKGHVDKERRKLLLQRILFQAVIKDAMEATNEAMKVLKMYFLSTGPGLLDFTCKQVNEALNNERDKLHLEGDYKEFTTYSPLMVAVLKKTTDFVEELIQAGASVGFKNKEGLTALHVACYGDKLEVINILLTASMGQTRFITKKRLQNDCQVFINAKFRPEGCTPLMYAVKGGHVEVVKRLMECDYLDCNAKNRLQQNVYHIAVREGKLKCLEQLCSVASESADKHAALIAALKTSDHKNWNILHQACTQDVIEVKWLLDQFEELKTKDFLDQVSKNGYTPFLVACEYYQSERNTVKYFVDTLHKEGLVDISVKCHKENGLGTTALHLAAICNKKDLAVILVQAGCSLEEQDIKGNTVLHVAMERGNRTIAKYICDTCKVKGIDLESVTNKEGKIPRDVEEEITIPPEIYSLGLEAVSAYEKALEEGKRKIPYCRMLILGESQVGKTSLYRQLVGKEFREDLESTLGIDNNIVDTVVDERSITMEKSGNVWHETEWSTGESFAKAVGEETRKRMPEKKEKRITVIPDKGILLQLIGRIKKELEPRVLTTRPAPSHSMMYPMHMGLVNSPSFAPTEIQPVSAHEPVPQEHRGAAPPKVASEFSVVPEVVRKKNKLLKPMHQPPEGTDHPKVLTSTSLQKQPLHVTERRPVKKPDKQQATEEPSGMITLRDSSIIVGIATGRSKHDMQETLTLIALDFAGQHEYRPMHHCFITRRACYLVVFKIPDMIKFIDSDPKSRVDHCNNPWEEFRYWIHSINAHIYPPDEDEKKAINQFRRIILVGTHRKYVTLKNLKRIDVFIKGKIKKDQRCVNHVRTVSNKAHPSQEFCTKYFIAVENSIDITKSYEKYLIESGTKAVQENIEDTCSKLPFLKEEYPIKWLKFTERIEIRAASTPVLSMKELIAMAAASRILQDDQQKLAIKFLHESGKIVCLEYLPHLFLSDEERKELKDRVVIQPQWLISVMKEIMKLDADEDNEGIEKSLVVKFADSGVASLDLLKMCWKNYLPYPEIPSSGIMELRHLCLLLQAYCLIFPVHTNENDKRNVPILNGGDIDSRHSESEREVNYVTSENINENNNPKGKHPELYLVPCRLPNRDLYATPERKWFSFYFYFEGFLPAEVYHRLLCKLLKLTGITDNMFSRYECILNMPKKSWKIRHKQFEHVLEVSVVGSDDLKDDLLMLHDYLADICRDSHLEGLQYVGGISGNICCQPGKPTLHYVEFKNGKNWEHDEDEVWCISCKQKIKEEQKLLKGPQENLIEIPIYSATMTDELLKYHLPKNKINGVDYESYCNKIKFILLTGSDHEFNAAATYLHKPSIEGHVHDAKDTATSLQPNIVIGTFAGGPIALIQTSKENSMNNFFETVIGIFPDANYIISTGTSFAVQQKEMKLGDVFISSGITVIDDYSVNIDDSIAYIHIQGSHMNTTDFLQTMFCFDCSVPKIFKVTEFRAADYQISDIISGVDLSEDSRLYNKTSIIVDLNAVGGDVNGRELMQLQKEGKIKGFIVIKSVTEYIDSRKNDIWKFTGAMAAVHYVEQKMMRYNFEIPIYSATMTDELLKNHLPKNKINGVDYESYCNKIKFILLTGSDHEFNAAATYLHNPNVEGHVYDSKDTATSLQPNIVIGTFAEGPIALIQTNKEEDMNDFFETVMGIFPDVKYIISTGTSFAVQQKEMKLGDVFISSGITVIDDYSVNIDDSMAYIHIQGSHMTTTDFLQTMFCFDCSVPKNFKVTEFRAADYQISDIISGVDLSEDPRLYNKTSIIVDLNAVGGDVNGRELMQLQKEGKIKGFIVIKSVTEYIDSRKNDIWKFTGAMAAVHYVEQKMMPYNYHVTSVDQYMSALESGDVVNVMVAKLIFLGPPMQGKTVTRQRLTKAIKNISSSDVDKSNTGVSEQTTVIICKDMLSATALAIDDDEWTTVDVGEEKLFCLNVSQTEFEDTSHSEYVEAEQVTQHSSYSQQVKERFIPEEPNQSPNFSSTGCVQSEHSRSQTSFEKKDNTRPTSAEISAVSLEWSKKIPGILMKTKIYNLEHLKKKLDKGYLLYMQDTGGQPELMECLPVLTIGPALYFLFCKLTSRLDETYKIGYRGPDGTTLPIQSHFTMKETLLSSLASVASMGYSSTDQDTDIQQQVTNREGCVYLIGTHRDEVKTIEAINHFESELRKVLESTFFYKKDLIKWWNEEDMPPESGLFSKDIDARLVYPLDNMFGENKEMKCLRSSIHKRLNKLFANRKIPTNWLVFGICLRQKEEGTVTLESCFELGLELNMTKDVTRAALHFLHYNLGICMHFSNIPALKDLVIPNTQSIYKSLTTLIESAFKPSKVVPRATSLFKKTGQFSIEKFKEISDFSLPLKTLVDILEHLNVIAHVSSDDSEEPMFFMPCILQNASDDEIAIFERENPISQVLSPLFIRYDCGFVPLGVFSSMVANLMQQASHKKAHTGIALKLKPDNLKRNHVQFWNGCDIITFIHKPEYIRIHTSQQKECDEKLYEVCPKIRNLVKNTLGSITESMLKSLYTLTSEERYKFHFQTYQFAFKCYEHSEHDHLCVVSNEEIPETMSCVWDGNNTPFEMRAENLIWYGKKLSPSKLPASEEPSLTISSLTCLRWTDRNGTVCVIKIRDKISPKWIEAGDLLGLSSERLKGIDLQHRGDVGMCIRDVLVDWLHENKGSYPTTWEGVVQLLEDMELSAIAQLLKIALQFR